ncbi:MAG: SCP2 sterol-binding domain-containing protein [Candidatus Jordarchaeales archaeon]
MAEELGKIVDNMLSMSEDELAKQLPSILPKLRGRVGELLRARPDVVSKIVRRMEEIDVKRFMEKAPEAARAFTDLVWEGVSVVVERTPELKSDLEKLGNMTLNFKATDSPLEVHVKISGGKISGGSGLAEKADLSFSGTTENIIKLMTGAMDPVSGFMSGKYKMDGNLTVGMKLAPVMTKLTKTVRGG